jgi:hypothetical protein
MHRYYQQQRGTALALAILAGGGVFSAQAVAQDLAEEGSEDLTETIPSESGDIVEQIEPEEASPDAEQPLVEASAGERIESTRTQLSGYARQSFELVYPELSRRGRGLGEPVLWRDAFLSHSQLVLRASYLKGRSFEATVSGLLGYTLHLAREAPKYSEPGPVDLARGELDPQLREAYVGFFWPQVDLRIGQQRIAWGRTDFQSPNDVLNARDLRSPFLSETELRYLPTPLVQGSFHAGAVSFELVLSPLFVPDRFDTYGTNWAPIQRKVPAGLYYEEFLGAASLLVDPSVEREYARLWQYTERPRDNGKGLAAGARISGNLPGLDVSAYYHYGYDSTPLVRLDPEFAAYLSSVGMETQGTEQGPFPPGDFRQFEPLLGLLERRDSSGERIRPITARYVRRHHVGLDMAAVLGPVIFRLDTAYETRRVYYRADLNSFASPTLLAVGGLEYQTGNLDDVVLLEFIAARLMDELPKEAPLLGYERNTTALAGTVRWTLGESWGVDLRGLVGLSPETYVLQPALRYKPSDAFTLRLGALLISGETASFGSYYTDNDTAFVQLRYAF